MAPALSRRADRGRGLTKVPTYVVLIHRDTASPLVASQSAPGALFGGPQSASPAHSETDWGERLPPLSLSTVWHGKCELPRRQRSPPDPSVVSLRRVTLDPVIGNHSVALCPGT